MLYYTKTKTKVNMRDFVHWVRERIRMGEDLASTPLKTGDRDDIIEKYNTHRQWTIYAEGMEKNNMPKTFPDKMKWIDCKVMLINFLKSQTGSNGFPLNYVVCDHVTPIARNNSNF